MSIEPNNDQKNVSDVNEITESKPDKSFQTLPERIKNLIESKNIEDPVSFMVYKKASIGTRGPIKTELCFVFDDIPDEMLIGKRFGAGRYTIIVRNNTTNKFISTYNLNLSSYFDTFKKQFDERSIIPNILQQHSNIPQIVSQGQSLDIVETLEKLTPLITIFLNSQKKDNSEAMVQAFQSMMQMQMNNFTTIMERVQNYMLDNALKPQQQIEENSPQWIETLIPILQQWLGKLFEPNGVAKKGTSAILNTMAQFKEAKSDKNKIRELHDYLKTEKGKNFADNALNSVGIDLGE